MGKFQFDSLADFFAMGGYGMFVWLSYAAFFLVVIWNWWQPRRERQRIVKLLRARSERQQQPTSKPNSAEQQAAQQ
jgi:heme exporter protein D